MNRFIKLILLWTICLTATNVSAQRRISGTVSDDIDVVIGANVTERDKNNRIVSQAITDMNGNFTMGIKDVNNTLNVSFMGYKPWSQKIGNRTVFNITLQDNTKTIKELVITAKKKEQSGGLQIPVRELAGATQTFSMDEMEGMAFESVDQALQGQIAGLDIVANSGNLGSGTTMRLRGTSTIFGNAQPLIVVNDHIFELPEDKQSEDLSNYDNEEQFSTLLNVNPEDIESIQVLKDATTAKWGSRGANGVIEIKLRRGHRGKTNVTFSYKFNGTWQPSGYKMLDGDGYTMMLKEGYYNPQQDDRYSINELTYEQSRTPNIYRHFNGNTDWVDALKQFGKEHKFYVTLAGGGEKATFRISAGYDKSTGTILEQKLNRFTTQTALDYWVSDRIKFSSNISMTFTDNHKNNPTNILYMAYNAMPNMSIYEKAADADGNVYDTGRFFNMYPLAANYPSPSNGSSISRLFDKYATTPDSYTSYDLYDMFLNGNPVARAYGAWNKEKQYNLTPQFSIEYKLLGTDDDHTQLNYKGDVQLNIYNTSNDTYEPAELRTMDWQYGGDNTVKFPNGSQYTSLQNEVGNSEYKSLEFTTRHDLAFYPHIKNEDHSVSALIRWELASGSSSSQNTNLWNVPNGITDPTVVALLSNAGAGNRYWRSTSFFAQAHYSYKSKYNLDVSMRADGSTDFGSGNKWGVFPFVGLRWNIIDEPWMKWSRSVISMLAFRPTWGITGYVRGGAGSSQFNKYSLAGYYNGHTVTRPENLSLTDLRWEKTQKINLGFNLSLLDDLLNFELDIYDHKTTDLMMNNKRIAAVNGFGSLEKVNAGRMRNKGWDLNFSTGWFAKVGKFQMKLRGNVAQNFNEVEEMDALILEGLNPDKTTQPDAGWDNLRFVNPTKALGSIYGLRYLGVYEYDYDHNGYTTTSRNTYGNNTAAANGGTCPIAYDAAGNIITDQEGNPLPMYYRYEDTKYQFQGGDAIYEDINHDGQIDRYDVVYLGNSNPKCYGGFGFTLKFERFQLNTGFNFRIGNQIVNSARQDYESMKGNTNQSYATTYRWRKNGDGVGTDQILPRAMNSTFFTSYNSLPSDRYVEDGDYLRLQYIQISYDIDPKLLKKWGIRSLKVFGSINNLWCWTKYTGVDPDISPGYLGIARDTQKTPRTRYFTASINLGF